MFFSTVDFSLLFNSIHGSALILGVIVYFGYTMLPTLRHIVQSMCQNPTPQPKSPPHGQPNTAEQPGPRRLHLNSRHAAVAGSVLVLLGGLAFSTQKLPGQKKEFSCPVETDGPVGSPVTAPFVQPSPLMPAAAPIEDEPTQAEKLKMKLGLRKMFGGAAASPARGQVATPAVLLARAHAAVDLSSGPSAAWSVLEACVAWTSPSTGEALPVSELHAQLKCNGELVEQGATTREASPALLSRARNLVGLLREHKDVAADTWQATQVEWARIAHGVFQLDCKAIADELRTSRKAKAPAQAAEAVQQGPAGAAHLTALRSLKRLEAPFRETLFTLEAAAKVLEPLSVNGSTEAAAELEDIQNALGADRACALQALQEGRSLALALPRNAPLVRRALQCRPRMLEEFQALTLTEAVKAKDAATMFGLGLYYSDISMAVEQGQPHPPLFGTGSQPISTPSWSSRWSSEPKWAADAGGSHAPIQLVQAEALMQAGEEASVGPDRGDRGAARALRLYQHAKILALKHHDSAAEWRYRSAAEIAVSHRRQKLASHALGRLSYFLSLRGRKEEALEAAGVALKHGEEDPLAQYLQASLRRSLGELRSTEEVQAAEKQLAAVAGKLPSQTLEDQRATAHEELGWWRSVATDGLAVCLRSWDASQFLICVFSGLVFDLPGAAAAGEAQ